MIEHIQNTYQSINADSLKAGILRELYTEDAEFIDPFHHMQGLPTLEAYFTRLYRNVRKIEFSYGDAVSEGSHIFMAWSMTVEHPRLKNGRPVQVEGTTHFITRDGLVCLHRDYFDAGEMLYENLPLIGRLVNAIKQRMGQ
ncbi:MAG: nuclear transport factor 2 family protein [Natronospirillum sp.]|uniref:nuclear transport factor 2 family protein n=1 Tax=Natronospirillum sp. TaxID=2812955 RepID=UPI0025FA377B|nr:nuclear transport factor 2 family protein [Natronospirillum sp.]MCH8550605.1 nuclear transport factor 2 family protein [Natronospirillum sp.]